MAKKRSIVSYDKLSPNLKKALLKSFPDGFRNALTEIKTPNGESLEALIWETDEIIYMVKITSMLTNAIDLYDDDENDLMDIAKPDDYELEKDDKPIKYKKKLDCDNEFDEEYS